MSEREWQLDLSDFDKKSRELFEKAMPALQEKAMAQGMISLLADCFFVIPTVPVKEGTLRGSGSIFVNNVLIKTSQGESGAKGGTPVTDHAESKKPHEITGVIGFNTPYAARLHENPQFKFTEPSSGGKFVEAKLIANGKAYVKEMADVIRAGGTA